MGTPVCCFYWLFLKDGGKGDPWLRLTVRKYCCLYCGCYFRVCGLDTETALEMMKL